VGRAKRRREEGKPRHSRFLVPALLSVAFFLFIIAGMRFTAALLHAGDVSTALYSMAVDITNTGGSDVNDLAVPFPMSAQSLIDEDFIASDALNSHVHKGDVDVPAMPPTGRITIEGVVQEVDGVFTEFTTAAQNSTINDVSLVPVASAVGALYFGCDNPCRIATFDVGTAGVGTWTLTYEYWDGDSFESLTNVDDQTSSFTVAGRQTASWDMPLDWATNTVTGSAVTSYWGRARVSAFTSQSTAPLGDQVFYENGQWWTWVESLATDNQERFTLNLGGSTNLVSNHQTFPGLAGILTGDNATLEVTGSYSVALIGRLDFSAAAVNACILCKTGAYTINVSGSSSSPTIGTSFSGVSTFTGDIAGTIPGTGEQTVIIASDGTNAATFFGATTGGMVSYDLSGGIYTDNGNNITWASEGGTDYFDSIRMDSDTPTVFNFETSTADFTTGTHTNTQAYSGAFGLAAE